MNSLIIVAIILIIIIGSWFWIFTYVKSNVVEMNDIISNINANIEDNDWIKTKEQYKILIEKWDTLRLVWSIFLDHHEIDNLDLTIAKIDANINNKNKDESLKELNVLRTILKIVEESESLTIENIF